MRKFMVLGVAFDWGYRKGLDCFIQLSNRLGDNYQVVLVGTNDCTDELLPETIISIHRTANQKELAALYTSADVFVNTTREDTYPTVNMEAIACGTPVITFNTGGSPEIINRDTGVIVQCDDVDGLEYEIRRICENQIRFDKCVENAIHFDCCNRYDEYLRLYEALG